MEINVSCEGSWERSNWTLALEGKEISHPWVVPHTQSHWLWSGSVTSIRRVLRLNVSHGSQIIKTEQRWLQHLWPVLSITLDKRSFWINEKPRRGHRAKRKVWANPWGRKEKVLWGICRELERGQYWVGNDLELLTRSVSSCHSVLDNSLEVFEQEQSNMEVLGE